MRKLNRRKSSLHRLWKKVSRSSENHVALGSYAVSILIVGAIFWAFGMRAVYGMNLAMLCIGPLVCGPVLYLMRAKNSAIYGGLMIVITLATSAAFFYKWERFSMITTYYALCLSIIRALDEIEKKVRGTRHEATWRHIWGAMD